MPTKKMDAKRAAKARRREREAAKQEARAREKRKSWMLAGAALAVGIAAHRGSGAPGWTAPTPIAERSLSHLGVSAKAGDLQRRDHPPKFRPRATVAATDKAGKADRRQVQRVPADLGQVLRDRRGRHRRTTTRPARARPRRRWSATCRTATPSSGTTASLPKNQAATS